MKNISLDLISIELNNRGKKARLMAIISCLSVILLYFINKITGEGPLYIIIASVFILNALGWLLYYNNTEKYILLGNITFTANYFLKKLEFYFNSGLKVEVIKKLKNL